MSDLFIAGRYRIREKLGSGAFGHTYLAEDIHLPYHPLCVVKQLKPESTDEFTIVTAQRLFPREAAILNKLGKNQQIPQLLAHLEENQEFYLVQEYIEGQDLDNEIKPGTKLEESQVIKILAEVLEILTFVHRQKVVHRDIKPSNIMRRKKDGKLFLIDFGAVKEITTQVSRDKATIIGTLGYIPVEQNMGQPTYASDIHALGMMAIYALTGIEPHQLLRDPHSWGIQWRHLTNVTPQLADIIDKMTHHDYQYRYVDAMEARQALQKFINLSPSDTLPARVNSIPENVTPKKNIDSTLKSLLSSEATKPSSKTILTTIGLLLTLGISGFSYYRWQQNHQASIILKAPTVLTYENVQYGIEMDYPENWLLEQVEDPFGTVARFYPEANQGGQKPVSVTIETANIEPNISLGDYSTNAIFQIIKHLPEAKIIDSKPIELNNKSAHRVVYTGRPKSREGSDKYLQVWFKDGGKVLILTYVASEDKYQEFSEVVEKTMISSLTLGTAK